MSLGRHPLTQTELELLIQQNLKHESEKHKFWQLVTRSDGGRATLTSTSCLLSPGSLGTGNTEQVSATGYILDHG